MNIKITYDWLLEYLDTDANPYDIQRYLSLCGPSVERVEKKGAAYVLEIEITSNRVDSASVFGIAQECFAILPQFGKKARLKQNLFKDYLFDKLAPKIPAKTTRHLQIEITNPHLCSRATAIVLSDVRLGQSPDFMRKRLELCAVKSINNLVDISNYLMIALGQPTHVFDYEKIGKGQMRIVESRGGEKIVTLDGQNVTLPGGDITIIDGNGVINGLAGIMGGLDSSVKDKTKYIVLFIETYNKEKIRRTSLLTGQRTVAASYFEKGLDEERVEGTLVYGVELLQKYAQAKIASPIYDIYPKPDKLKTIKIKHSHIQRLIGVDLEEKKIMAILSRLGFAVKKTPDQGTYLVTIPPQRKHDINVDEDIVEEIARIHGYFNLPAIIQKTDLVKQPREEAKIFDYQTKIKHFLKHLGLNEVYNYSMVSASQITTLDLDLKSHLKIKNSLSSEIEYLRTSLIPSILKNIQDNQAYRDECAFFETAKVYLKQKEDLPKEPLMLAIAVTNDFFNVKGVAESLFEELNLGQISFRPQTKIPFLSPKRQVAVGDFGWIGQLSAYYQARLEIKPPVFLAYLDCELLVAKARSFLSYKPITPYATVKLDLTVEKKAGIYLQTLLAKIGEVKPCNQSIEKRVRVSDSYRNRITFRFYFFSQDRNITLDEGKKELENIAKELQLNRL